MLNKTPEQLYNLINTTLKERWLKAEPIIAKDAYYAYYYALDILKGRFPEGEATIAKDAHYAYLYTSYVLEGKFS